MYMPQIRMQSQLATIGMQQQIASLDIEQPKADLTIKQNSAKMEIKAALGQLTIDQTKAWEEANLMSTQRLIEKQAQMAQQTATEGTARRAEQGSQLMKIEQSADVIINQALENGFHHQRDLSLTYIPSPFSVKIDYIPADGTLNLLFSPLSSKLHKITQS